MQIFLIQIPSQARSNVRERKYRGGTKMKDSDKHWIHFYGTIHTTQLFYNTAAQRCFYLNLFTRLRHKRFSVCMFVRCISAAAR